HRAVHEGGIQVVVLDDGAIRFIKPNGYTLDSIAECFTQPLSDWTELPTAHAERGIHIDNKTAATRWCGETMDYGLGVEVLLQKYRKAKRVSAETPEGDVVDTFQDYGDLFSSEVQFDGYSSEVPFTA